MACAAVVARLMTDGTGYFQHLERIKGELRTVIKHVTKRLRRHWRRTLKIGARVIEHIARIRIQLPTSCPERALFRAVALGLLPSGP
jgi:hypothetical protein